MAYETLRGVEMTHRYANLGDVRLHYVEAGEGPLVLLLHGFPQFWYEWRHQIPALVEAGFRVVAPDMRGYNLSDKPPGVRAYRVDLVARDVKRKIASGWCERESGVLVIFTKGRGFFAAAATPVSTTANASSATMSQNPRCLRSRVLITSLMSRFGVPDACPRRR